MEEKLRKRVRRHKRIRKKIFGTENKPRLCVYRGLKNIQAQLIDDLSNKTIITVSSGTKAAKKKIAYGGNIQAAKLLGQVLAEQAKKKGISEVVFDRAGFQYHGRIRALAEAARENGLKF